MKTFEEINNHLLESLQADQNCLNQLDSVMTQDGALYGYDFLGFVEHYYHLSLVIPKGRTVYDFGCCGALHSWFFRNHKKFVGIDAETTAFMRMPNSEFHTCTTAEFLSDFFVI